MKATSPQLFWLDDHQTFRVYHSSRYRKQYEQLVKEVTTRRKTDDFQALLSQYDSGYLVEAGPVAVIRKCMLPEQPLQSRPGEAMSYALCRQTRPSIALEFPKEATNAA